jgi:Fur family ferric uptake transcriptional regulator
MSCESAFLTALRERGMRMTPQREMVLSVMHDMHDHASVEEIYRRVQERSAAVDISTIYRTLDLLQEMNMLAVVETADGGRRYALAETHGAHVHLVCQGCGHTLEAEVGPAENLAAELARRYGFVLDIGHLSLVGACAACAGGGR